MNSIKKFVKGMIGDKATRFFVGLKYGLRNLLCAFLPMNNEIIFESHPDLSCNAYALYQHMLQRGINRDYKLTWLVREPEKYKADLDQNLDYLPLFPKTMGDKIKTYIRCNRAKAVFSCHTHVSSWCVSTKQINVFLDHGSHLKSVLNKGERFPVHCGYLNCQSEFFVKYNVEQYTVEKDQVISLGLPRNDLLFTDTGSISRLVENRSQYKKVIMWAPTFRRHHGKERIDCDVGYPLGLPVFQSEEDAIKLNTVLAANKLLLIIKPHPASDMSVIKEMRLSNVMFLYNSDLAAANIQLNELLAQTDAMITDYSSIFYDYLLLDRPIGLTLDDYNEYTDQKGFVFEDPLVILKGEYLYNLEDLCVFAVSVANGEDKTLAVRTEVKNLVHYYQDDRSSQRICDFLLEKLESQ